MSLFLMMTAVFGFFFSILFLIASAIFRQPLKRALHCISVSVLVFLLSIILVILDVTSISGFWITLALLAPVVFLVLLIWYIKESYKNRPLSEEQKIKIEKRREEKVMRKSEKDASRAEIKKMKEEKAAVKAAERDRKMRRKEEERQKEKELRLAVKREDKRKRQADREWNKEARIAIKQEKERKRELARTIVSVQIIGGNSKSSTGSTIGRAIVGDFVAGPIGAIIGAGTANNIRETDFLITYADGKKKVESVPFNSYRYKELIQYL